eukprot:5782683-Pyramimonas_sp.AAC.1
MMDQLDTGSACMWVCSHDGPIRHRKGGYAGMFSRWTNQTQEVRVCSPDGPIRHRKRGYILPTDQSGTGSQRQLAPKAAVRWGRLAMFALPLGDTLMPLGGSLYLYYCTTVLSDALCFTS